MRRARLLSRSSLARAVLSLALFVGGHALGEPRESARQSAAAWSDSVKQTAAAGSYLPLTLPPDVTASTATGIAQSGYDGARGQATLNTALQARVLGPLALRAGAAQGRGGRLAPSVGARVQALTQSGYGLDVAASFFYKAEGFTEMDGELETAISVGRSFERWAFFSTLAYGQDPEGRERDAEVALACLLRLSSVLQVGFDSRVRFDAGSAREKLRQNREPLVDVISGPVLGASVGPVALGAQLGLSGLWDVDQAPHTGLIVLGGIGTSF